MDVIIVLLEVALVEIDNQRQQRKQKEGDKQDRPEPKAFRIELAQDPNGQCSGR